MLSKSEVKYIQTLSQKKFRKIENLFVIEGPKMVEEALVEKKGQLKRIYAVDDWTGTHLAVSSNIEVIRISYIELQKISQLKTPNQVLALVVLPPQELFVFNSQNLSLMLDGIQDPGNLGTIIRIADWFGIQQIICSEDCADAYNYKVVQATMGSIFRVQLHYTSLAQWILENNPQLYGAVLHGTPLKKFTTVKNGVLVIGNESKGISDAVIKHLKEKITIEKYGIAESLNAAVATGIILSQIR